LSSEPRVLQSIRDLSLGEVADILEAARRFERDGWIPRQRSFTVGLLFLTPSLRTRVGFAVAAARLGGTPIDVHEVRAGAEMSASETVASTLRAVSGMVDVTVVRTPGGIAPEAIVAATASTYVNGGDGSEHPTQTLIDVYAIERLRGPIAELRIGICGDLTMRAARSLLRHLARVRPRELVLIAPEARGEHGVAFPPELEARVSRRAAGGVEDLDVLVMIGLPPGLGPGRLSDREREAFALSAEWLEALPRDAVVLSPGPIIDEITPGALGDPRIRIAEHADLGVFVRMAVLELLLD